jgi:DNA-binding transcriptional ArsR family regulator
MLDPDFLAAIGHPARLRALVLLEREPANVADLATRVGLSADDADQHVRQLADAHLIEPVSEDDAAPRWRTRATGWAGLTDLLAEAAGGSSEAHA